MRYAVRLAVLFWCAFASLAPASAERKVALIIGNSLYGHHAALPNVPNDAAAMATLLKGAGFDRVDVRTNLSVAALRLALQDFHAEAGNADVAVLFYAGHGIEVGGTNYLIPVDARLATDYAVQDETVALDRVLDAMEGARRLRLVLLDACRENPFVPAMKRTGAGRSVGRGLGRVDLAASNTLIAFATKPNAIALDGEGSNSPFTAALVKHLATPGLDLRLALGDVRDDVLASTAGKQEPYLTGSLGSGIFAIVGGTPKPPPTPPGQPSEAERAWPSVKDTSSIAALEVFIRRFGDTYYGDLAKVRLAELKQAEALKQAEVERKKSEDDARAKTTAERVCANVESTTNIAQLKTMASIHKGTPAGACILARIESLQKHQLALAAPPPAPVVFSPTRTSAPLTSAEERSLKAADSFKECSSCPEMVVVPAGSFKMGSPPGEAGRADDEGPQRKVTIARPFAVGKFEVTFAEWDACAADGGCQHRPDDQGWGRGRRPLINVSWHDAKEYVGWLSRKAEKHYRLVSEAEWEYAARAGTTTRYAFGDTISKSQAQFSEGTWGSAKQTVEVGSFPANKFELHDMHGDVWEWLEDSWHPNYQGAPIDGSAWLGGDVSLRVLRGGSWINVPDLLRSANRGRNRPVNRDYNIGFRVARTL